MRQALLVILILLAVMPSVVKASADNKDKEFKIGRWEAIVKSHSDYEGLYQTEGCTIEIDYDHSVSIEVTEEEEYCYFKQEIFIYLREMQPFIVFKSGAIDKSTRRYTKLPDFTRDLFGENYLRDLDQFPSAVRDCFLGFYGFPLNFDLLKKLRESYAWRIEWDREDLAEIYLDSGVINVGLSINLAKELRDLRAKRLRKPEFYKPKIALNPGVATSMLDLSETLDLGDAEEWLDDLIRGDGRTTISDLRVMRRDVVELREVVALRTLAVAVQCAREGGTCFKGEHSYKFDFPERFADLLFASLRAGIEPYQFGTTTEELCELFLRMARDGAPKIGRLRVGWLLIENERYVRYSGEGALKISVDLPNDQGGWSQHWSRAELPVRISREKGEEIVKRVLGHGYNMPEQD